MIKVMNPNVETKRIYDLPPKKNIKRATLEGKVIKVAKKGTSVGLIKDSIVQKEKVIDFFSGNSKSVSPKEAFLWAKKMAKTGESIGLCRLANCYDFGIGVRKNLKKAFDFYLLAAEEGNVVAQYNLSLMYSEKKGRKNSQLAFFWMEKAAKFDPEAMADLGYMYMQGSGVEEDFKKAAHFYKKAARKNVARAYHNLGLMTYSGEGVKQSDKKAIDYFVKALSLKYTKSMLELAEIFLDENSSFYNKKKGQNLKKRYYSLISSKKMTACRSGT